MLNIQSLLGAAAILPVVAGGSAALAQDEWNVPPPPWEGAWQGTIGALPVHVCLNNTPYKNDGAYYYDRLKKLIRLNLDEARTEWIEEKSGGTTGPRWKIAAAGADAISGTWSDGRKSLPVRLKPIAGASRDYEGPCASMAFHGPRLTPARLTSKPGSKDGERFTSWTFRPAPWFADVEVGTFTLDRPGAAAARINAKLREVLPKSDGTGEWFDCMRGNANAHGSDGAYDERLEPTLIAGRWLAVSHHGEYYCGGAHPENYNRPRTFDLQTGAEIFPHDWFKPSAMSIEHSEPNEQPLRSLTDGFLAAILKGWKHEDAECDDVVRTQKHWQIGIARGALVFSPDLPRVVMACGEEFKLPFARLQPWLNDKGKAAVATLPR